MRLVDRAPASRRAVRLTRVLALLVDAALEEARTTWTRTPRNIHTGTAPYGGAVRCRTAAQCHAGSHAKNIVTSPLDSLTAQPIRYVQSVWCPSVRLCVCLFPFCLFNRLTFDLDFCTCRPMFHEHRLYGTTDNEGHRSRSEVNINVCVSVLRNILRR